MRSASFLLLSGAVWGLVNAAPVASSVLGGTTPSSTRWGSDKTTGATLESLRILPDDDNDGLLDVAGSLKMLQGGEVLDVGGVVRVGGLLDACFEVVIDGVPTKRCDTKGRGRKHRNTGVSKDGWTKEEHRECAAHFKSWHKQHGSRSCSDRLRDAEKKIRELEKRLNECQPNDYRPYHPVSHIKTQSPSSSSDNNNDNSNSDNANNDTYTAPKSTSWSGDASGSNNSGSDDSSAPEHQGQQWRDDTRGKACPQGVRTYTDKNDVIVKACVQAEISVGPVSASASVGATATVDIKHLSATASATANAKVGVAGVAQVSSKNSVTAGADLEKGEASANINTDDALKVGKTQVVKTGLDASVQVNKKCSEGSIVNAAGICVALTSDKNGDGALGLGNILGAGRSAI